MPWNFKPWGCSGGRNGSCNDGWIQFEICEDNLCNPDYFDKVYWEACELTAYLCKLYNIDPMGTVKHNGVTVPTILCHQDSFRLGLGSNHGDIYHWFPKYGKSMETVREDVSRLLRGEAEVTQEQFNQMMDNYLIDLAKKEPSDWSQESRAYAESTGLIKGGKDGSKMYKKFVTREELVAVIHRLIKNGGI